jgi:hypothetical protein
MATWQPTPEGITTIVTLLQTLSDPAQAAKHAEGNQVRTINAKCYTQFRSVLRATLRGATTEDCAR